MYVLNGGISVSTTANSGGTEILYDNGIARTTLVNGGGFLLLSGHSTASATTLLSAGFEGVFHGGTASGTIISSGGKQVVYSGGTDRFSVISSGGTEVVSSGGTTSGVIVRSGGTENVLGLTEGDVLNAGTENISTGGLASSTIVNSGSVLVVSSGGGGSSRPVRGTPPGRSVARDRRRFIPRARGCSSQKPLFANHNSIVKDPTGWNARSMTPSRQRRLSTERDQPKPVEVYRPQTVLTAGFETETDAARAITALPSST
jgi:autotransporter passenger strand-loop-strand repeat protein